MFKYFIEKLDGNKKMYEDKITALTCDNEFLSLEIMSLKAEIDSLNAAMDNTKNYRIYEKNNILHIINGKKKITVTNPNYKKHKSDKCGICAIKRPIYGTHCGMSICVKCFLDPTNVGDYGNKCLICKCLF